MTEERCDHSWVLDNVIPTDYEDIGEYHCTKCGKSIIDVA
jgi:hypothetical protein